jgi:hypothetical protein
LLLAVAATAGCGGGSEGWGTPKIEVFGAQTKTLDISGDSPLEISCTKRNCTPVAGGCNCTCTCTGCTKPHKCTIGCINDCSTLCRNVCTDDPTCGTYVSSTGDCPSKATTCEGSSLEYRAETIAGKDSGSYFRFSIAEFDPKASKTYEMKHDFNNIHNNVVVGFPNDNKQAGDKDFKYELGSEQKSDTVTYRSHCNITINPEDGVDSVTYSGPIWCTMLWAAGASQDYLKGEGGSNVYVDIWGYYSCKAQKTD